MSGNGLSGKQHAEENVADHGISPERYASGSRDASEVLASGPYPVPSDQTAVLVETKNRADPARAHPPGTPCCGLLAEK